MKTEITDEDLFIEFVNENRDRLESEFRENNEDLFCDYAHSEFELWKNEEYSK